MLSVNKGPLVKAVLPNLVYVWASGSPQGSKLVSFGDFERQPGAKRGILIAFKFQGGPQAPKRSHLGSFLGAFWR